MATDHLDPTEVVSSTGGTAVGTAGEPLLHETVDDGVRQPAEPDVSDYCDFVDGGSVDLHMATREVQAVSDITIWVQYSLTGARARARP
jgi:hypothetical protein